MQFPQVFFEWGFSKGPMQRKMMQLFPGVFGMMLFLNGRRADKPKFKYGRWRFQGTDSSSQGAKIAAHFTSLTKVSFAINSIFP